MYPRGVRHPPDREGGHRRMDFSGQEKRTFLSPRIPFQDLEGLSTQAVLRDRSDRQLDDGRRPKGPPDVRSRLGGFDPRKHLRRPLYHGRNQRSPDRPLWNRIYDRIGGMVSSGGKRFRWLLSDRRWDRGRLSDLRRADAQSRRRHHARPSLELFLSDQRFNDQFRIVLW